MKVTSTPSCTFITKQSPLLPKGFEICIDSHQMDFICDSRTLFCAPTVLTSLIPLNRVCQLGLHSPSNSFSLALLLLPPQSVRKPLELVHSDLHGPLSVATREGYCYWMTFIDDATSHHAAMKLKQKSDAFKAFKTYKAYTENHFQTKMKEFQDDKGGEYMSNTFIKFTDECGIHRHHSTRNRPQQNSVAE